MADESFYTDDDLTGHGEFVEGQTSLGVTLTVPAGTIKAVRWRYPAVAPTGAVLARVYSAAGSLLASKSAFDATTLDSWNIATFTSPLVVSAGTYRAVIVTPNRYPALGGFFASGAITRGSLTLGASWFASNDAFPTSSSTATYYVDVVFAASGPTEVNGVLSAAIGPLSAALTGTREVAGVEVASLGPLTAAMAGTREVQGVATAAFGGLTAALSGGREVQGTLAAQLGPLTGSLVTVRTLGPRPPIVSRTAARILTTQTREARL